MTLADEIIEQLVITYIITTQEFGTGKGSEQLLRTTDKAAYDKHMSKLESKHKLLKIPASGSKRVAIYSEYKGTGAKELKVTMAHSQGRSGYIDSYIILDK